MSLQDWFFGNVPLQTHKELIAKLGPPMDQAEVDRLPQGACVIIRWVGGNGPHVYKVKRPVGGWLSQAYASMIESPCFVGFLTACGTDNWKTSVWDSTPNNLLRIGAVKR